jgi:hypothetical protein
MKTTDILDFNTEKSYTMPSGLGGSFTLKFIQYSEGNYLFKITNPDFEKEIKLTQLTINQVKESKMIISKTQPTDFSTGQLVASMLINSEMKENAKFALFCQTCLEKHKSNNWGDLEEEDLDENNFALENGNRLFSKYLIPEDLNMEEDSIYVITEWDRSYTTILFPMEY